MAGYAWAAAPPKHLTPSVFTTLPASFRTLGTSEHSTNQKRGRPLDSFLEGPVVADDNKTLYLADIPYGRIFAVDLATRAWSLVVQYDGEPNGLAWHRQRNQLIVADFKLGILGIDLETREVTPIMQRFNGERLKGPNDVVVSADGDIYFTDQGMSGLQDPIGRVYRLQHDGGRVDVLLRNCPSPNGLVLDGAGTSLFVAMTRDNAVWHVPLYPDGSVQRTGRFASYYGIGGPDGMATDEEGNIFVAHSTLGAVFVHDKHGNPVVRIDTTAVGNSATNMTWGGMHHMTLFIVESESGTILCVEWHCKGLMYPPCR
ncbi:uncharacterized protein LTHEOB_7009 [Lasiodiplodia theobromae]|uniref:uncharacterized protein n=1 Tax=Lasiodiplodia theobromae TaxID=45133 RepID=UPI0015C2D2BE|nr:uncharacterized protein LTHEOB_7009 [Lasiodiplodia theobromae]KAF4543275.1 hypothetical protein LTHEOB_7009 [Lasiodiplodia theobromae]